MELLQQTYFSDILHAVAQALLLPAVIALLALVLYAVWCIGALVVEWRTEHAHYRAQMPDFLEEIDAAQPDDIPYVIAGSGLLGSQKRALLELWDHRRLPVDSHVALAKRLIEECEDRHTKTLQRTLVVSKIAPMLGLMGTLIPLGPGLISLGQGGTLTLSASLLVAFDTTVAGLVVGLVTYTVTKIRQRWYDNYQSALEASCTSVLEKVDGLRQAGALGKGGPTHFLADLDASLKTGAPDARDRRPSRPQAAENAEARPRVGGGTGESHG